MFTNIHVYLQLLWVYIRHIVCKGYDEGSERFEMRELWIRLIKYTAVGSGSLLVFILLVIGAAGVQAALSDHRETNVSEQVSDIQDKQFGRQVMLIVESLHNNAKNNIAIEKSNLSIDDTRFLLDGSMLEKQILQLKLLYTGNEEAKILSLLQKWHTMSFKNKNWTEVENNTWVFMKEAAERYDVFWAGINEVPDDLHYKISDNNIS